MTHEDTGNYSAKHPGADTPDPVLSKAISEKSRDGSVSCPVAFQIADQLGVPPGEVGRAIDLQEIRLAQCQLGLFGYTPQKKIVKPAETVSEELQRLISELLNENRLSCSDAWSIAQKLGIKKIDVSSACEKMKVKIISCQLGAF